MRTVRPVMIYLNNSSRFKTVFSTKKIEEKQNQQQMTIHLGLFLFLLISFYLSWLQYGETKLKY